MLEENQQNRQIILILCFLTGSLIHKYLEKPICDARLPWKTVLTWLAFSYAVITVVAYTNDVYRSLSNDAIDVYNNKSKLIIDSSEWKKFASSITPEMSAQLGVYSGIKHCDHFPRSKWPDTVKEAWTYGADIKGTGNLSILIIGNSHAECVTPGIKLAMEGLYSQLSFVAIAGVTPFEGFQSSGAWFVFQNAVKYYKPDIVFLMFKYQTDFEDPITDSDYHTMKVQEMITF
uniref:Uncharacterized protein n=1 Tax=Panagrolaimus davidi TaxID=227884 RepID=A0A914PL92_9BILA